MAKNQPKAAGAAAVFTAEELAADPNSTAPETSEACAVVSEEGAAAAVPASNATTKVEDAIPAETGESPPPGGESPITHIHVRAFTDGFRRAGRAWPAEGVVVPVADFSADELEQLLRERALVVTPASAPDAE